MLFPSPISFSEALDSRRVKTLLPTTASSAELATLPAELLERGVFSARTASAAHLSSIDAVVMQILDPGYVYDPHTGGRRPAGPGEHVNPARAREILRESLKSIGYSPDQIGAEPGSLKDLASEMRLNLIIKQNTAFGRGYGQWKQGQTDAILDEWPAQEFIRIESRRAPRPDWRQRWEIAGGQLYEDRMIALKNDPVWTNLSVFNLPYPPFDYGSGMGVRDVDRDEAMRLGLIDLDTRIAPQDRGFNADLAAPAPVDPDAQPDLFQALQESMGRAVTFDESGVMRLDVSPSRQVGESGSATSLSLPRMAELRAARTPQEETLAAARQMLNRPIPVNDPAGGSAIFGKRDIGHVDADPDKRGGRLREFQRAIETVREPDEIWDHPEEDKVSYVKTFDANGETSAMLVLKNRTSGEIYNWYLTRATRGDKRLDRKGTLLYARRRP